MTANTTATVTELVDEARGYEREVYRRSVVEVELACLEAALDAAIRDFGKAVAYRLNKGCDERGCKYDPGYAEAWVGASEIRRKNAAAALSFFKENAAHRGVGPVPAAKVEAALAAAQSDLAVAIDREVEAADRRQAWLKGRITALERQAEVLDRKVRAITRIEVGAPGSGLGGAAIRRRKEEEAAPIRAEADRLHEETRAMQEELNEFPQW